MEAPHTGVVRFAGIEPGTRVVAASGTYGEKPGTLLAKLTREHNDKPLYAEAKGVIGAVHRELEGTFVEAGAQLAVIRHYLSKDEVIAAILRQVLSRIGPRTGQVLSPSGAQKVRPLRAAFGHGPARDGAVHRLAHESGKSRSSTTAPRGPPRSISSTTQNVDQGAPLGACAPSPDAPHPGRGQPGAHGLGEGE